MTVALETNQVLAAGNGTTFAFPFAGMEIYSKNDLLVLLVDLSDFSKTILSEGTSASTYSVAFTTALVDGKSAGTVTYPADQGTAITSGFSILMVRIPDITQGAALGSVGVGLPAAVEDMMDKLTHQVQYLQNQVDRVPIGEQQADTGLDWELPTPVALETWRWNAALTGLESVAVAAGAVVTKENFTALNDTPSSYPSGSASQILQVNSGETALELTQYHVNPVYQVADDKPDTLAGGTFTQDAWQTRQFTAVRKAGIVNAKLVFTLTLATVLAAETLILDGLTFTAHATVTTASSREFSISGNDTADALELESVLSDGTYGTPNITWVDNLDGTLTGTVASAATLAGAIGTTITGATIVYSACGVSLPAGTYRIRGSAPAYDVAGHQTRLYDLTGTADIAVGSSELVTAADAIQTRSVAEGEVVLSVTSVVHLDHYCIATKTTDGLGVPVSTPSYVESYAEMYIERIL